MNLPLTIVLTLGMLAATAVAAERVQTVAPQKPAPNNERRVALVIGNGAYKSAPLRNPVNDARAMARALAETGFTVTLVEDAGRAGMRRAIRDWGDGLAQGGVGLFYFAGHGMQIRGRNYLIPVSADVRREDEVEDEAIDANTILAKMDSARNSLNVMILDACRNNPFARSFRSASQGLAQMEAPSGTLIAFATAPGSVAADGDRQDNGIYTGHLLTQIRQPGLAVEQLFKQVRIRVAQDTGDRQVPWESSSLKGDFYFLPAQATAGGGAVQQAALQQAAIEATRAADERAARERAALQERAAKEQAEIRRRGERALEELLAKQKADLESRQSEATASPVATLSAAEASAQQAIVGDYQGEYFEYGGAASQPKIQSVALQILSANDGSVSGRYVLASFGCRGTYEVNGTYRGGQLTLRTSGGEVRGCEQQLTLSVQGNKLVGRTSGADRNRPWVQLHKR